MNYNQMDYSYTTYSEPSSAASLAAFMIIALIIVIFGVATYAISSYLLSRIFKKAGVKSWKAWVPIYNNWLTLEIGGQSGWIVLVALIPIIGPIIYLVKSLVAMYNIGLKLGKPGIFVVLAFFLQIIWTAVLALDNSTWNEETGEPRLDQPDFPPGTSIAKGSPAPKAT